MGSTSQNVVQKIILWVYYDDIRRIDGSKFLPFFYLLNIPVPVFVLLNFYALDSNGDQGGPGSGSALECIPVRIQNTDFWFRLIAPVCHFLMNIRPSSMPDPCWRSWTTFPKCRRASSSPISAWPVFLQVKLTYLLVQHILDLVPSRWIGPYVKDPVS